MTGVELVKIGEVLLKFKDQISKSINVTVDEIKNLFDNGIENYLTIQYQKYAFTKTFLYRETPVDFYQTFYPVKIKHKNNLITTENITTFLHYSQFVGIIGQAGSGKTMLMKHIFLTSFNSIFKIPIVVEIRNLNLYDGSFNDYLVKTILDNKIALNDNIMQRLLQKGAFLFLLDGYDEIYSEKKQKITEEIDLFIDSHNNNHFVISSRPGTNIEALPRFHFHNVQPLSSEDITRFIDHQVQYFEDKELIKKIKDLVQQPENIDFKTFIQNPLLLSMFILTYADHPELPKLKSTFYYNVYDTLATKHDTITKKGGYQHERQSGLQKDEIVLFLRFFSLQSLFEGKYSFDDHYFNTLADKVKLNLKLKCDNDKLLYDLLVSVNIFLRDGNLITYPHKSLQEFFAAACISSQGEDFKQKVYHEKLYKYFLRSVGAIRNFWDMLVELDKEYFFKLFLIPNVNRILREISFFETSDVTLIVNKFLIQYNFVHYVQIKHDEKIVATSRASHSSSPDFNILGMLIQREHFIIFLTAIDVAKNYDIFQQLIKDKVLIESPDPEDKKTIKVVYSQIEPKTLNTLINNSTLKGAIFNWLNIIKSKLDQIITELDDEIRSKVSFLD